MFGTSSSSSSRLSGSSNSSSSVHLDFYYQTPPSTELSLSEFEDFALSRLIVLRKIEEMKIKAVSGQEFQDKLRKTLGENLPTDSTTSSSVASSTPALRASNFRKDCASHFILRLAYCRTEDLRRWFLTQETALFKYRLQSLENLGGDYFLKFLKQANLTFIKVSEGEKKGMQQFLSYGLNLSDFSKSAFYKIPFHQASELISRRDVYVSGGFAFVPSSKLLSIVSARFRAGLSKSLALAGQSFSAISEDTRIAPLLKNMNKQYTGRNFGAQNGTTSDINASNVDELSKRSMPLCMKMSQVGMKRDHKLKHWARLQYGLFLKAAGLEMEEALLFFQTEFTKIMTSEQFTKGYAYNIRHMYGKEGKRASYTPYNCTKIIMGNPPAQGDLHGCPFRHYDDNSLSALLGSMGISGQDKDGILHHKKTKNFQLACAKHFEVTHPGIEKLSAAEGVSMEGVGNHPNAWMESSVKFWKHKEGKVAAEKPKREKMELETEADAAMPVTSSA
jgi:DNA primase large subunit